MKTIKIFLASSEELKNDRVSFGNFIRELDKRYQQRGIRIDLYTWEGADGAYNGRRKQDEYNDNVRDSGMLVALFYRKAGGFTQEEFHEAIKNFNITGRPKVYVYFRQLEDESEVSEELKKFKEELEGQNARGHFAYRYNNDDSLHLDFVMQLLLQDKIQKDELNIEEGQVMLNGIVIAQMDNLQFATDNKGYQDLIKDLENIETEMNEARQALVQNPNIEFIKKHFEISESSEKDKEMSLNEFFQYYFLKNREKYITILSPYSEEKSKDIISKIFDKYKNDFKNNLLKIYDKYSPFKDTTVVATESMMNFSLDKDNSSENKQFR